MTQAASPRNNFAATPDPDKSVDLSRNRANVRRGGHRVVRDGVLAPLGRGRSAGCTGGDGEVEHSGRRHVGDGAALPASRRLGGIQVLMSRRRAFALLTKRPSDSQPRWIPSSRRPSEVHVRPRACAQRGNRARDPVGDGLSLATRGGLNGSRTAGRIVSAPVPAIVRGHHSRAGMAP